MTTYTSESLAPEFPTIIQDISEVHCKPRKWQQRLSCLHFSRCRRSLMHSLYHWSQLWKVPVHSYFLIPATRGSAALAKEGMSTGMNLNINGKHKLSTSWKNSVCSNRWILQLELLHFIVLCWQSPSFFMTEKQLWIADRQLLCKRKASGQPQCGAFCSTQRATL